MYILSGFADEISPDLDQQLATLQTLEIRYLELRGVWGKNVLALDDAELRTIASVLDASGIRVSAIGSPIGKIDITAPFEPHLVDFQRTLQIAELLQAPYIRIFSFFVPAGEAEQYRGQVMERMHALVEAAQGHSVVLLHENESHIYGDIPERCLDLHQTIASSQLRATFDPANFVMNDIAPYTHAYPLLADWVEYLHIKDGIMAEKRVVPAGEGDGQIRELIAALTERGFDGFASLEPHLASAGAFSGFSGPQLFTRAVEAFRSVLTAVGVKEGK
ncbi:MAG: TIM barrel protein [Chloroflexi bacterium]|nr:TIM barrel protein [Chloroflexota bacterium]